MSVPTPLPRVAPNGARVARQPAAAPTARRAGLASALMAAHLICAAVLRCARWRAAPWAWLLATLLLAAPASQAAKVQDIQSAMVLQGQWAASGDWSLAHEVILPDEWVGNLANGLSAGGSQGTGAQLTRVYRIDFNRKPELNAPLYGLYLERACSLLQVQFNGQLLYDGDHREPIFGRTCHRPQLVTVPASLVKPQHNLLVVTVSGPGLENTGSRLRAGGLSAMELGPYPLMVQHLERRELFASRLPQMMSGTLALVGGYMVLMAWFNRRQSHLGYYGGLLMGWGLMLAWLWADELPWPAEFLEPVLGALMGLTTLAAVQFLLRLADLRPKWVLPALLAQAALLPVSLWGAQLAGLHLFLVASAWHAVLVLEVLVAAGLCLHHRRQKRDIWRWPVIALLGLVLGCIGLDLAVQWQALDARLGYVARLLPALGLLVMGFVLAHRFGRSVKQTEQSHDELELRIREATAQIERNFAQLAELKVEQVTDRERKRIAADLHDDLGAKLLTIVHTSESERISTLAREALEEMRLSVRGLTGKPVKLADALGDWRAEVVSRLNQSGVQGEWSAPSDEDTPQTLSSRAYVQTTRILREAVSNVIKHSGASQCTVRATITEGDFQVVIQDNGRGIPVELEGRLDKGHGMASMKGRAKQLSGQCLVESGPGYGTVIRLTLPLERHVTNT